MLARALIKFYFKMDIRTCGGDDGVARHKKRSFRGEGGVTRGKIITLPSTGTAGYKGKNNE